MLARHPSPAFGSKCLLCWMALCASDLDGRKLPPTLLRLQALQGKPQRWLWVQGSCPSAPRSVGQTVCPYISPPGKLTAEETGPPPKLTKVLTVSKL